ncbi:MAG TPA: tRNA dimethylallyltransferase, partial [Candidatus Babeliaceae bacterium]|nr:tRNA dimethylallyltransferase [Candidatus Babeliaceae bacterium]
RRPEFLLPFQTRMLFLTREREDLYGRINQRVYSMLEQGWLDEVAALSEEWKDFVYRKKLIGYPEIVRFLETERAQQGLDCLVSEIQQKTRQYAKRQLSFWRMFQREVSPLGYLILQEINLTLSPIDLYIMDLKTNLLT